MFEYVYMNNDLGEMKMCETKFTYEQYCTYYERNVILQEIICFDGKKRVVCTNTKCMYSEDGCKNKLRVLTEE